VYVLTLKKVRYNVVVFHSSIFLFLFIYLFIYFIFLLLLRWDTGKIRDRFGSMGRVKGRGQHAIMDVITSRYFKYNAKTCK